MFFTDCIKALYEKKSKKPTKLQINNMRSEIGDMVILPRVCSNTNKYKNKK